LVGWIGGWIATMPATRFWPMHAGFALGAGLVFLILKFALAKRLHSSAPEPSAASV
jgi:proton-dependent oligopeptide transporter, POT family